MQKLLTQTDLAADLRPNGRRYTLGEEIANSVSHGVGALLSIAALVLLIVRAVSHGGGIRLAAALLMGVGLLVEYLFSTLYHAIAPEKAKRVFRVLDHCGIYLLIAGSYAPYAPRRALQHEEKRGQGDADAAGKGKEVENEVQVGHLLWNVEERAHRVADAAGEQKPERPGGQHLKEVVDVENDSPAEQDVDERGEPFGLALAHEALEHDAHEGDRPHRDAERHSAKNPRVPAAIHRLEPGVS